jgi:WD40 repeat protein
MAIGGHDGVIRLVDLRTGAMLGTAFVGHSNRVREFRFLSNGQLVSVSSDRKAILWDAQSGERLTTVRAHSSGIASLALTPDESQIVTGDMDGVIKLNNIHSIRYADSVCRGGHEDFIFRIAFDRTGQRFVSPSADGSVCVWSAATGEIERYLIKDAGCTMHCVACSPRDAKVVACGLDGKIRAWNGDTGDLLWSVTAHGGSAGSATSVSFSPDGSVVVSGGRDGFVRLLNASDGAELRKFPGRGARFSPKGKLLAVVQNEDIVLLDWRSGEKVTVFAKSSEVGTLAFSHDGETLAIGGRTPPASLWDVATGERRYVLQHGPEVTDMVFSPDDRILATSGIDGRVCLWDVATGAERGHFKGHVGWVESVAFSPDGTILASAGDDRTIRLWRAASPADGKAPHAP